uniref:NADH-ubiquinone oxidoreductase chain 6 n=1 Tax=Pnyxia scabiei TaxID=1781627 RepID=A0A7L9R5A8_9DIPT|nr:NADH dehydrogenase subunit 6 [Pnyxia scabiei]QOL10550.1 NADH dehydrogenase subunit 6 [Pnyxia scabiei]
MLMFQPLLLTLTMLMSLLFFKMKHPLSMGLILVIQTLLICLLINLLNESMWISYMLFLMFISGMLVLFMYITTLAPNELFLFSYKTLFTMTLITLFTIFILYSYNKYFNSKTQEMNNMNFNLINKENLMMMNKIYNYPINYLTMLLIIYLFMTLIITIKITNFNHGALRKMH